jgi:hypothetical protein
MKTHISFKPTVQNVLLSSILSYAYVHVVLGEVQSSFEMNCCSGQDEYANNIKLLIMIENLKECVA